ncbi:MULTISPECIES: PadR family transcriptional regulator [Prauserella salsuginis group]|uniref:DNA-binding PadR family transcriptional regulator n=2 Tax=Prauserella salsuginis group TaxID=2893672 RepID=A0A839XQ47_9PSEU|nr:MULTISPECIES: PadR family transcriptional regulator [Prauserella salsuginis group]MBB3662793.1 DNA-binding PadR family transcriptional regulator [Prauserella sediminis]MCR3720488.1 DNA-binding transcriptional regulator, PadR family [Prauserella flava]MCR3733802.1 DNA-binding transcriptional regulator, PadR family [Prauserella salsuginis]
MLEFAILGLLHEAPMHGYVLRKRLHESLGMFRTFSYGSLYPTLRRMQRAGWIAEDTAEADAAAGPANGPTSAAHASTTTPWNRRASKSKRVYKLTAEGKERFGELLADAGPQTWDDEGFGVHLTFFSRTPADVRMRILEGRRRRVEERREGLRAALARAEEKIDRYTRELHELGLETSEREVRWLNELIAHEKAEQETSTQAATRRDPGSTEHE